MKKLLLLLILSCLASLFIGVGDLTLTGIIHADPAALELLFTSRLPRLSALLLSGAGLSIAGLIMQQVTQNRFAAPSTAGTIQFAKLGYIVSLVYLPFVNQLFVVFGSAMAGTLLFVSLIHKIKLKDVVLVPLIGIIIGEVIDSATSFIAYKFDVLQSLGNWSVANFSHILTGNFELLYIAIPVAFMGYWYAARISAVGMGKEFATNLGLNYQQVVMLGVMLVSVMSASVVMIVGQLPFLGLIVPNLVSAITGDNLRKNIPLTAIVGALLVLGCDIGGRLIVFPYEIPISIIISILGGLVFIYLIIKGKHNGR
ncbi:siderophore ABC transporter permease [Vibrio albus]|uniref:Siderophore ABC transporter permease n=1 Tax=Vibrio albus TaxID=2200953 RepID=A0A2U3BD89_9VIBR|nr:iron chelate uptake ABC transporter family permease subunit [Vibrio albus]PWI34751.1 siderophore ABC transporter permease [Vibrio albus]